MPDDILILLVGENPLPNWVVAKYLLVTGRPDQQLLPRPSKIILLHSHDTQQMAKNLHTNLKALVSGNIFLVNIGENERDAQAIRKELGNILTNFRNGISSLHLNYTGGTKPMAVHSYLEVFSSQIQVKKIFSDLNPTTFKIQLAEQTCNTQYPVTEDLRDKVSLSLQEIFQLHSALGGNGIILSNQGATDPTFSYPGEVDIYKFANEFFQDNSRILPNIWDMANERNKERKTNHNYILPWNKIISLLSHTTVDKWLDGLYKNFPSLTLFNSANLGPTIPQSNEKFDKLIDFFTGKWLEDFILVNITDLKAARKIVITELRKNVEVSYKQRPAEMDVIVLKGYELFLFSCTTSEKIKEVKLKAFEALYRAEQLGGAHAQSVIVSLLPQQDTTHNPQFRNDLESLEKDLSSFGVRSKYYLIGKPDLQKINGLQNKLVTIIQ